MSLHNENTLNKIIGITQAKLTGNTDTRWMYKGHCPSPNHPDKEPSFEFGYDDKYKISLNCWNPLCTHEILLSSMRLEEKDLYPPKTNNNGTYNKKNKDNRPKKLVANYEYKDNNKLLFVVERYHYTDDEGGKKFYQKKPVRHRNQWVKKAKSAKESKKRVET